jgi:5,10-methylenetetrahydrofolate reductase
MILHNSFKTKVKSGVFTVTAEISSPKGINTDSVISNVNALRGHIDAVNICDCPMANMRMSSIALAYLVQKHAEIDTIPHISCRDRNTIGIQSELLGAAALGIKNLLAITGDVPGKGDHPNSTGVFELDSTGLIDLIKRLNSGTDYSGNNLEGNPDFFIGAAANPGAQDLDAEVERLAEKVHAGAGFIQTQPVYDIAAFEAFIRKIEGLDVPVLLGILPLKSYKMAINFKDKVGISIPQELLDRMKNGADEGIRISAEIARKAKGLVQGIHIMPLGSLIAVREILSMMGSSEQKIGDLV